MTEREVLLKAIKRLGLEIYVNTSDSLEFENQYLGGWIVIDFDKNGNIKLIGC